MSGRVLLAPDVLLAAVGGASAVDGAAARRALRGWIEDGTELLVAAPAWPGLIDALRTRGWPAARIAEALHALDGIDLVTIEQDRPALLLALDAMERHDISAAAAAAVVLAELDGATLATLDPALAAAADQAILGAVAAAAVPRTPHGSRRPSLPDYRGLAALLGELRRSGAERQP